MQRSFKSLSEQEVLALAISLEEEDARILGEFAEGLEASYPATTKILHEMSAEEDGHRHRLIELHRARFGEHIPLIQRQHVKGFVERKPIWLVRPLGLAAVRKETELMELETKRFYEAAARRTTDAGIRQLLGDLAAEERRHAERAEELQDARQATGAEEEESAMRAQAVSAPGDTARPCRADGRVGFDPGPDFCRGLCDQEQFSDFPGGPGREHRRRDQHGLCRSTFG